jgi:hypothetical protein
MKNMISKIVCNSTLAFAVLSLLVLPMAPVQAADYYPSYVSSIDYSYPSDSYYPSYVSSVDYSYPSYDYYPSYVSSVDYSYPSYDYYPSYVSSIDYSYPSYDYSPSYVSSIDYSYPSYSYPSYSSGSSNAYSNAYASAYASAGASSYSYNYNNYYNDRDRDCKKNCDDDKPKQKERPSCDMWFSDTRIDKGDKTTLHWESDNVDDVRINEGIGDVSRDGSRTVRPNKSTTYIGTFEGENGNTIQCAAHVTVDRDNDYIPPKYYPPQTPYVTLSSVPYTGLELGPVGTAVYWSFLVLWAVLAAYLIAVKRLHEDVYRALKRMLFGEKAEVVASMQPASFAPSDAQSGVASRLTPQVAPAQNGASLRNDSAAVDPFILSQIKRKNA